jgi:hypothetical protein
MCAVTLNEIYYFYFELTFYFIFCYLEAANREKDRRKKEQVKGCCSNEAGRLYVLNT